MEMLNYWFCLKITLLLSSKLSHLWEYTTSQGSKGKEWRKYGEFEKEIECLKQLGAIHLFSSQSFLLVTGKSFGEVNTTLANGFEPTMHQLALNPFFLSNTAEGRDTWRAVTQAMILNRVSPQDSHPLVCMLCAAFSNTASGLVCVTDKYGRSNGM